METLVEKAERLQELPDLILEALISCIKTKNCDEAVALVTEYGQTKKDIKLAFLEKPAAAIPESENKDARKILQAVVLGEELPLEKAFNDTPLEGVFEDELSSEELEELGTLHFYSWFSHYEYVEGMYRVGALIARIGSLPENLGSFLQEVRQCFAFQQYLAVCALCRTVLEISVRDLYNIEGFNDSESDVSQIAKSYFEDKKRGRHYKTVEDYDIPLSDLRNVLCKLPDYKPFYWRIRNLYEELSRVIHGSKTIYGNEAEEKLKMTLQLIHDLYET